MTIIDAKELETIKLLTKDDRRTFCMEQILESGFAWGLVSEQGWASFLDDEQGVQAFPIWSEEQFAELNAVGDWAGFKGKQFTLQELKSDVIPGLQAGNFYLSIFKLPEDSGDIVEAAAIGRLLDVKTSS